MPATPTRPRRKPRLLEVASVHTPAPGLRRVTLVGSELSDFPRRCAGAHIKVFVPRPGQREPVLPTRGPSGLEWPVEDEHQRAVIRTYSVRRFEPGDQLRPAELDVEFVIHGHGRGGPASKWAAAAAPGDRLGIAGPGGPMPMLPDSGRFVLAGDLSARPAMTAIVEQLAPDRRGVVLMEIDDGDQRVEFAHPVGVELHWIVREAGQARLLAAVRDQLRGSDFLWVAGEHHSVVAIREFARTTLGLPRCREYAVPYWKRDENEEQYHMQRHAVMDDLQ